MGEKPGHKEQSHIEIEQKLTLAPNTRDIYTLFDDLTAVFQKEGDPFQLQQLAKETTFRKYYISQEDGAGPMVEIYDPEKPHLVKFKTKTAHPKGGNVLEREETVAKYDILDPPRPRDIAGIETALTAAAKYARIQLAGYRHLGPLMQKDRQGIIIHTGNRDYKVTFDRLHEAVVKKGSRLDQIEVEFAGNKEDLQESERKEIYQEIQRICGEIQQEMEKCNYTFEQDSPTKDAWMKAQFTEANEESQV